MSVRPLTKASDNDVSESILKGSFVYGCFEKNPDCFTPKKLVFSLGDLADSHNPENVEWEMSLGAGFSPMEGEFSWWWALMIGTMAAAFVVCVAVNMGQFDYASANWQMDPEDKEVRKALLSADDYKRDSGDADEV